MSDIENWSGIDFESGTDTVTREGDHYEIEIDGIDIDGKNLVGTYCGILKYYDLSDL